MDNNARSKSATRASDNMAQRVMRAAASRDQQPDMKVQAAALAAKSAGGTRVSSPNDPEEKEADNTAQKVMRMAMPDSRVAMVNAPRGGVFRLINRKRNDEKEIKRKTAEEKPETEIKRAAADEKQEGEIKRAAVDEKKEGEIKRAAAEEEPEMKRVAVEEKQEGELKRAAVEEKPEVKRAAKDEKPEAELKRAAADKQEPELKRAAAEQKEQQPVQRAADEKQPQEVKRQADKEKEPVAVQRAAEPEEKVQRKEQAKEEQPKEEQVARKEAGEEQPAVSRKAANDEEPAVARKAVNEDDAVARQAAPDEDKVSRKAEGTPNAASNVGAEIRGAMAGGEPLPLSVRRFMEPRFNADFSNVRIHTGTDAARMNRQVSAKAFAVRNHIFFGKDQFQPESDEGKTLLAHELTHTIQQGGATQGAPQEDPSQNNPSQNNSSQNNPSQDSNNVQRAADDKEQPLQRKANVTVSQRTSPRVARLGIRDALDYFADHANNIPGFRMFTIVIGVNPINMRSVDRSPANILRAVVEFMPGGALITRALDNHGVFDRVGNWVAEQLRTLAITGSAIRSAIDRFLDSLSWTDIFDLGGVWDRAKRIFTDPINRIKNFVSGLVSGILRFIRDAILMPLANLASRTSGWNLLCAVLGSNPITGDPVPRNADTLIGGFMELIGQQEVWNNIKRANAVARAWSWFQGALAGLMGFVRSIPTLFLNVFRSLGIRDLVDVPGAFARVARVFGSFAGRFFSWAGAQVMSLLQIIFEVVAPGAMPFIRRAAGAFQSIIRNPIGFVGNLVRAGQMGFRRFATNFLTHLRTSLINWLTGTMSGTGVYIPQAFTLRELIKFVLSVLGLTWQNIRQKLVRAVGERAVAAMETGFELVRTLITEGPAAAWQKISEGLSNLREMVIEQVMTFVRNRIVQAAITRLVSMLTPAGAFIQAIIGIYNTIMFFVERLRTIAQVAMSFVNSIAAIAAGNLGPAAARVEQTMAGALTLVISFLARIAGLGRVATVVTNLINRVRAPIDRALDRVVAWIVAQARRLGRFIAQAGVPQDPNERMRLASRAAIAAASRLRGRATASLLSGVLAAIRTRYGLQSITPFERGGNWWVRIVINPTQETNLGVSTNPQAEEEQQVSWPVTAGQSIKVPETTRIAQVVNTNPPTAPSGVLRQNSIVYYYNRSSSSRITSVKTHAQFMALWNAGQIQLSGEMSAEQKREELTRLYGAQVADAIMRRGDLAENVGILNAAQAHHIIPVEILQKQGIMRLLVNSGWNFNAAINGIALDEGFHGNHPAYTAYVNRQIDNWISTHGASNTAAFRSYVENTLIPGLRTHINTAKTQYATTGVNLNSYFAQL